MVDLLGHAGHLQEAENMMWLCGWLCSVPAQFMVMRTWGECIAKQVLELECELCRFFAAIKHIVV
jgi:hypothetical protein